ncbi:c-type cytochrome [Bacillus massilinigeriensis]|uniref:c-type cytochrome n=1 Tax=Bacillus massilionigeriensis TaxID=1805475 RepID=UPI00096B4CB6|nr:cytochrome C [Bacillus massilionigeriensis]
MKKAIIQFFIFAVIGLGIGYLVFDILLAEKETNTAATTEQTTDVNSEAAAKESSSNEQKSEGKTEEQTQTASASAENNIFQSKGCLGCHSIEKLDLQGGSTGPDLSQAYKDVEGKHGKPIEEFLKEPTSAVMSGVISGNPLSDDEISQVVELLKQASEK